jgi:hypothetical protein
MAKIAELQQSFKKQPIFFKHTGNDILSTLDEQFEDKDDPQYLAQVKTIHVRLQINTLLCIYDTLGSFGPLPS